MMNVHDFVSRVTTCLYLDSSKYAVQVLVLTGTLCLQ
jgi:hypothetical protein